MSSSARENSSRSVGRPREFDEDQVLDAVMEVFWRQGYESTSLADLLAATGLHKGSLYQAFGDKHTLFITALRRYVQTMSSDMNSVVQDAEVACEGLRAAMYKLVDLCACDNGSNPGCMALNTLVEKDPRDEEVRQVLESAYSGRMKLMLRAVRSCQQQGSIRGDWQAERIAAMLDTLIMGLAAALKGPVSRQQAKTMIDDLLDSVKPPVAA